MKVHWRVKRDGTGLWVEMFTDGPFPYFAARRIIEKRNEAREAVEVFVEELRTWLNRSRKV